MLSSHYSEKRRGVGYSLLELMVALGLLGILMAYITSTFTMQYQTYTVVDQVSETQNNVLAVAALIERDIRNAGYAAPVSGAACGHDSTSAPDVLFLSDATAVLPIDQLDLDLRGDSLHGEVATAVSAGSVFKMTVDDVVLDRDPSYDTDGNGTLDSDFQINGGVILVDLANDDRGVACGVISEVDLGTNTITFDLGPSTISSTIAFPPQLALVPANVYAIVAPNGNLPPEIRRNNQTLARDIEDLQVAWFFDDNRDGNVDALEYRAAALQMMTGGGAIAVSPAPSPVFTTSTVDGSTLRELRVNLVSRTRGNDPRQPDQAGIGQARENRINNVPAVDGRRRRVHSATVRLRNVT